MSAFRSELGMHHWVEHQIRQAQAEGQFDNLGHGAIDELKKPYREGWWLENLIERESLRESARTTSPLADIRNDIDTLNQLADEESVRRAVNALNERLQRHSDILKIRMPRIDPETIISRWRSHQDQQSK